MRSYRAGGHAARPTGVVMEGFKEFLGKTLDAAIEEACSYYNANREKLEIEIVQDAKTGIFGIVGARKAKVRARRAALREVVESALGRGNRPAASPESGPDDRTADNVASAASPEQPAPSVRGTRTEKTPARESAGARRARGREEETSLQTADPRENRRGDERGRKSPRKAVAAREEALLPSPGGRTEPVAAEPQGDDEAVVQTSRNDGARRESTATSPRGERPRNGERGSGRESARDCRRPAADDDMDEADESLPRRALEELDQDRLKELARECVANLIRPMLNRPADEPEVDIVDGRVRVAVDCGEDSGLLIGREGQTLAALQYLASRIVSRGMDAAVRVQLDAGRYRQRQEEKLRDMALALAAKVRQTGRSYSTRPLSSYHRRIIHLCLQEMDDIVTRSTGDGPLKRVVILRRRPEKVDRRPSAVRDGAPRPQPDDGAENGCPVPTPADLQTPPEDAATAAGSDGTGGNPSADAAPDNRAEQVTEEDGAAMPGDVRAQDRQA